MDIRALMSQVPEMDRFLTLDELNGDLAKLATDHPWIASIRRVGRIGARSRGLSFSFSIVILSTFFATLFQPLV